MKKTIISLLLLISFNSHSAETYTYDGKREFLNGQPIKTNQKKIRLSEIKENQLNYQYDPNEYETISVLKNRKKREKQTFDEDGYSFENYALPYYFSVLSDLATTTALLSKGGEEKNPIYGSHPNLFLLYGVGVARLGLGAFVVNLNMEEQSKQNILAAMSFFSWGVTGNNISNLVGDNNKHHTLSFLGSGLLGTTLSLTFE